MVTVFDQQLISDYSAFHDNVVQCYHYLINGDDRATDLAPITAGQAMALAARLKLLQLPTPPLPHISIEQSKPWELIGISRATWYRDQQRSRNNEQARNNEQL